MQREAVPEQQTPEKGKVHFPLNSVQMSEVEANKREAMMKQTSERKQFYIINYRESEEVKKKLEKRKDIARVKRSAKEYVDEGYGGLKERQFDRWNI